MSITGAIQLSPGCVLVMLELYVVKRGKPIWGIAS